MLVYTCELGYLRASQTSLAPPYGKSVQAPYSIKKAQAPRGGFVEPFHQDISKKKDEKGFHTVWADFRRRWFDWQLPVPLKNGHSPGEC